MFSLLRWSHLSSCFTNHGILHTDNRKERVQFDKITARVTRLCYGLDPEHVDAAAITQKVISGVYQGVTTVELDNLVSWVENELPHNSNAGQTANMVVPI